MLLVGSLPFDTRTGEVTTMSTRTTVYEELAAELSAARTQAKFGLAGEDNILLIDAVTQAGIAVYPASHENVAVNMADGFSWRSGQIGVCTVTRGSGVLNAATAIRTAARAGRRVLVITGDIATDGDPRWDLKALDYRPLVSSLGAEYFPVASAAEAVPVLREALEATRAGRTSVFAVPVDILLGNAAESSAPAMLDRTPTIATAPSGAEVREVGQEDTTRVARLLMSHDRPLVLAGQGVATAGVRDELEELARRTGALLGTTLLARDLFRGSPYNLGVVGGFSSDPAVPILAEIDCVIAFGASLNSWTTGGATLFHDASIIQVDTDPEALGANLSIALGICADAAATVRGLLEAIPEALPDDARPLHDAAVLARLCDPLWDGPDESLPNALDPRAIATALDVALPEQRTVVLDTGRFLSAPGRFMHHLVPDAFRHTADAGSIGMGLGVALGGALARPDIPAVLFVGDGGLSMSLGDLGTAARHHLPLVIVVMNDQAFGAELVHLQTHGLGWDAACLPDIDFAACARALGIEAATVHTLDELERHTADVAQRQAPLLLDCKIRRDLFETRVIARSGPR